MRLLTKQKDDHDQREAIAAAAMLANRNKMSTLDSKIKVESDTDPGVGQCDFAELPGATCVSSRQSGFAQLSGRKAPGAAA